MINSTILLDFFRLTLLAIVIGYAAWSDHKCGEVKNKVWIYAPFGFSLTLLSCIFQPQLLQPALISIVATTIISFAIFYIGGWGGADAKAFLTIGASLPVTPFLHLNLTFMYPLNVIWICSALSFGYILIKNKGKITWRTTSRFLPYVSVAMFLALLI